MSAVASVVAATCSVPARRLPLYLRGSSPTRVDADGVALVVRRTGHALARYPFPRLSRIIASQRVEWSAAALATCVAHEVPIVFLGRQGEVAAYLNGVQRHPSRLDGVLAEFVERTDWVSHYANWQRSERMRAVKDWCAQEAVAGSPVSEDRFREMVRSHVYGDDTGAGLMSGSLYYSVVAAFTTERVQRAGLRQRYWGHDGQPLNLSDDLGQLLMLRVAIEVGRLGAVLHGDEVALLQVLHAVAARFPAACDGILGRLHRRMKELAEEWR